MITTLSGLPFEATLAEETGLIGDLRVVLTNGQSTALVPETSSGITEYPAGSGIYGVTITAPAVTGTEYAKLIWSWYPVGSPDDTMTAVEDVVIYPDSASLAPTSPSGGDLCTLADIEAAIGPAESDDYRQWLITAASNALRWKIRREFAPAVPSATRRFRADGRYVFLTPYDLRSAATVTLDPAGAATVLVEGTDYDLMPVNGQSGTYEYLLLATAPARTATGAWPIIEISGAWGYASVPAEVRQAAIITVSSWERRDQEMGAFNAGGQGDIRPVPMTTYNIPQAAQALVYSHYRWEMG